ncbi:MAG: hypothetical protein WBC22_01260 [Sedimentisphaerales bacterium]
MKVIWLIDKPEKIDNFNNSTFNIWNIETSKIKGRARFRVKTKHFWNEDYTKLVSSVVCFDEDYDSIVANLPVGVAPFLSYDQGKEDIKQSLSLADFTNIKDVSVIKDASVSITDTLETILTKTVRVLEDTDKFILAEDVK